MQPAEGSTDQNAAQLQVTQLCDGPLQFYWVTKHLQQLLQLRSDNNSDCAHLTSEASHQGTSAGVHMQLITVRYADITVHALSQALKVIDHLVGQPNQLLHCSVIILSNGSHSTYLAVLAHDGIVHLHSSIEHAEQVTEFCNQVNNTRLAVYSKLCRCPA